MRLFNWTQGRVKSYALLDLKLIALAGLCAGLIIANLIPSILDINVWWFVGIGGLATLRVYYVFFLKK